jgi:uncharacterized protein (TIGR02246 family)
MKTLSLISFAMLIISCQTNTDQETDMPNLMKTIDEFYTAIEAGDFEKRMELFADSAIVMPNGGQIIRGREVIKERWAPFQEYVFQIKDLERLEVKISANFAHTINSYYYTSHLPGEEAVWHKTKNIHIWQRQADGSWKLYLDIWNSSES